MHMSCTCTHPSIRCASAVRVLRSSWRLRLLAAKKKIGLTCKPGQEPRAAQAGLRCHLRGEQPPPSTATPEAKASLCKLPAEGQECGDGASLPWLSAGQPQNHRKNKNATTKPPGAGGSDGPASWLEMGQSKFGHVQKNQVELTSGWQTTCACISCWWPILPTLGCEHAPS